MFLSCQLLQCVHTLLNFSEEKQIKVRIKELMKYRRNGITKMDGKYAIQGVCHSTGSLISSKFLCIYFILMLKTYCYKKS